MRVSDIGVLTSDITEQLLSFSCSMFASDARGTRDIRETFLTVSSSIVKVYAALSRQSTFRGKFTQDDLRYQFFLFPYSFLFLLSTLYRYISGLGILIDLLTHYAKRTLIIRYDFFKFIDYYVALYKY